MTAWKLSIPAIVLVALFAPDASAQSIYGTITGIVADPSHAVIANATVKLKDQQSGSLRDTVTNSDGFYTFISVPPGAYQITVTVAGFETYAQSGIGLGGGDKLNVNVIMKIGNTANTVEVTGIADLTVPVDSGEKADRLTEKELENFIQIGSNAAEFIKMMPGFGISNGTSNIASYTGEAIGINGNGNGGNQSPLNGAFSYNGLPGNSLDITADGAHVSDPGCNCATPVNPNSKMISEFKITISNFNAESQKGPGVISSVARGGGQQFHGSAFMTLRDSVMNANDWLSNYSRVARPENKYQFPGFNLGGPVLLPFTKFNRNRDKLFFFTGYQYFRQIQDTGLLRATVPTEGERQGDFSPAELAKLGRITASGAAATPINAKSLLLYPGGIIPASQLDPNMKPMMKNYPLPNADPNANGGYNWVDDIKFTQNQFQWMSRVDYSISDNTKLYVRYNMQRELQLFPIGLWSTTKLQQIPYPSITDGKNRTDSVTVSLTKVLNPTMTNEFVFGYTFIGFPNVFENPAAVDRKAVGFNVQGLFKNGVAQIPNIAGNSSEAAAISTYGGFEVGGASQGFFANKYLPSVSDTVAKVWGTHTLKAGIFWEWIRNAQPFSNNTQGQMSFNNGNSNTLGNVYADMVMGIMNSYNETSFNRLADEAYSTWEGFVQDSWKVTPRLSVEAGLRMTHFQPWQDRLGFGFSVFDYSQYKSTCAPLDYCGFLWNGRDKSVPNGGFPTRGIYWQPRLGFAYSLNTSTVLRGGWGRYYYHSSQFTTGLNVSAGMQTVTRSNNQGLGGNTPLKVSILDQITFNTTALSTGAVDSKDDRSPYTDSYSLTLSRRVPWSGLVEVAYVGNQTKDMLNTSGGAGSDINLVPIGAMLSKNNNNVDPNGLTADNFRPMKGFSALPISTHNLFANYNSLQTTYRRTKGSTVLSANYTFGKAMGILSPTLDSFNLNNDYGVQSNNRKHIFNAAYSYTFPAYSKNKLLGGFVNRWQLSGITQLQSGVNLTGQRGQTFSMALNSYKIPGTTQNVSSTSFFGTPNITLTPVVTCDATANLAPQQYINPACFAPPKSAGDYQGAILPVFYGPWYFNSDLGVFKNFKITEKHSLQFRANGFNFLNHPLWSFNGSNLNLGFTGATGLINTPQFGTVNTKQGHRVVQLAVTYSF